MPSTNIFYTPDKLKKFLKTKVENKKIVMCHGVFDILHIGHMLHFKQAKKLGDILIVSITEDKYVKKGLGRPFFDLKTRMETVSQIKGVDYVIASHNPTAIENLKIIKPNIYFKGPDYSNIKDHTGKLFEEIKNAKSLNIDISFSKGRTHSSSNILNKMNNKFSQEQIKFIKSIKKEFNFSEISNFFEIIAKKKLSIMGEIIFDKYFFSDPVGVSGKDPFLVFKERDKEFYLGGAFSMSNNISNFCNKINLLSFFRKKNYLKILKSKKNNNLILNLVQSEHLKDIQKTRYVDWVSKNKIFGVYDYFDGIESEKISTKITNIFSKKKEKNFIIVDYGHGFLNDKLIKKINSFKYKYTLNAQINSSNRGYHGLFKYKFPLAIIINENELRYEFKDKFSKIENLILKLKNQIKSKIVIVTKGKQGSILLDEKNRYIYCPSFHENVIDKVGAGDTLLAFFSLSKFSGLNNRLSLFIASIAAGINVSFFNNKEKITKKKLLDKIQEIMK